LFRSAPSTRPEGAATDWRMRRTRRSPVRAPLGASEPSSARDVAFCAEAVNGDRRWVWITFSSCSYWAAGVRQSICLCTLGISTLWRIAKPQRAKPKRYQLTGQTWASYVCGITIFLPPVHVDEPHGVRTAGWISLSGCHPNRVQANVRVMAEIPANACWGRVDLMPGPGIVISAPGKGTFGPAFNDPTAHATPGAIPEISENAISPGLAGGVSD
jgi:hypothetical protein